MAEGSSTSTTVTCSQTRVKKEDDSDSMDGHSHEFNVKFSYNDDGEFLIYCEQPRTVLEAIKSHEEYQKRMTCADENIVIQLGEADREFAVPTHFPCSCIKDGELLIISRESEKVEEAQNKPSKTVHPRYSVFYIDTKGGRNAKSKKLFRSNKIKQFKYLCVYGEKGMTVEECLKRDGRFIDDLGDFELSDNASSNTLTGRKHLVNTLNGNKFKICLPREQGGNDKKLEKPRASSSLQRQCDPLPPPAGPVLDVAQQRGTSVKTLVRKSGISVNTQEIYDRLRQQFPKLKELMESRFPDDSYQKAVDLKRENFGKIQQSFSEIYRVRELLKLGESVCYLEIDCFHVTIQGTGFVLFDNFILTNAHLFSKVAKFRRDNPMEHVKVTARFNYENPDHESNFKRFNVKDLVVELTDDELDYAVLALDPECQKPNQTETIQIPPGLLKRFGPLPENGGACIIGHLAGQVKQMDPTCIIEKENRWQVVSDYLEPYKNCTVTLHSICQELGNQRIEEKIMNGENATYNTFMYHGSSGSPVFDAHCRVFGLHTSGLWVCRFSNSVIEFAQPLLTIFERLLTKIKESGNEELLRRFEEEAKGNPYLETVFESVERKGNSDLKEGVKVEPEDPVESMVTD